MTSTEKVDAVVVGAGAAGSFYAAKLAAAGKKVRILEAGPAWRVADLYSSQLWARRLKWGGSPIELSGDNRLPHNSGTGWGLGGAALHHYGTWPRFAEESFELNSRHGKSRDWPLSYADLRPHYDRIQTEVGISGDAQAETWRPEGAPYPMPPLKTFRHGELIRDGFHALGLATAPLPLAINSTVYNGRPPCVYDGWCDAGCPTGALANPLVTYLADAVTAGVEVTARAEVTRVLTGPGGEASGVEFVEAGERKIQPADYVILAGSIIQNPRLLLNSASDSFPDGLANSSGLVGRYLFGEGMAVVYGLFEEETDCHMGVSAGQFTHREGFTNPARPGIHGGLQWQIGPAVKPNDLFGIAMTRADLFGQPLHDFVHQAAKHFAFMVGFCGGEHQRENRVALSTRTDQNGMPLAHAIHSLPAEVVALSSYMDQQGRSVFEAAGARQIWSAPPPVGHLVGGTIMGRDPSDSVTDSYGICHDVPNLVLAGSGLFPASDGASPTFTLLAVASRSVDHLLAGWSEQRP